jgi:hypothetical protein
MFRSFLVAAASVACAAPAFGTITVDIGTSTSGGSVANALNITSTSYGWTGAQIVVELTQGSVINLPSGSGGVNAAPTQAQINALPALAFDTYFGPVGQGIDNFSSALELSGSDVLNFGPTGLNVLWYGSLNSHPPVNDLSIANLVFSDDAQGTWSFGVTESYNTQAKFIGGSLEDGVLVVDFLEGDLARDGFVGIEDLNNVLSYWNQSPPVYRPQDYDPSRDDFVGIADLNTVLGNWNAGTPQGPWSYTPTSEIGDLDGDGWVGVGDLNILLGNWHQTVTPGDPIQGDPSGDGFVGLDDWNILATGWNSGTPPIVALPEPAGIVMLVLGAPALLRRGA